MYEIDHVVLGVPDVLLAAQWLRSQFGLGAVVRGAHPDGTADWVVPLRDGQYLELLYIVDRDRMAREPEPRGVMRRIDAGGAVLSWSVRAAARDTTAARSGYERATGDAILPDGHVSRWHAAVHGETLRGVPSFIQYDDQAERDRRRPSSLASARHDHPVGGIAWVELAPDRVRGRLLEELAPDLPVRYATGGRDPITAVGVEIAGEVVRIAVH